MSSPVRFSVITVCLNAAQTIEKTLTSVLAQDHPHVQYIVIDGGSTDGTQAIISRFRQGIDIFLSEKDDGMYHALNKGIRLASGEVIALLNADDIYADNTVLSKMAGVFHSSKWEACYGDLVYFSAHTPDKITRYWRSGKFVPGRFAKGWSPPHPTFFVRKSVYERAGDFDTTLPIGNDAELMMRFLEKYQINCYYLPEVLVKMRLGGISNRSLKNILNQNRAILQAAKKLQIRIHPLSFLFYKILNRLPQFIVRP